MASALGTAITDPLELHILFILLDSNLPTGGFVSSSGLESFAKHAFLNATPSCHHGSTTGSAQARAKTATGSVGPSRPPTLGPTAVSKAMTRFGEAEVENYARSTGPFVIEAWRLVARQAHRESAGQAEHLVASSRDHSISPLAELIAKITALDSRHEACLLSHVSRRSSKAQGVALLTLFTRGLSAPPGYDVPVPTDKEEDAAGSPGDIPSLDVIDEFKRLIRKGVTPGHLAVCWGVMTAALGLPLERSIHLYLFLHARSLLSSAVRLNLIGPYLSSQLLLHPYRTIIDRNAARLAKESERVCREEAIPAEEADPWAWTEEAESGPATTWPLGEILVGRHDLQHSRIFNS